LIVIFVKNFPLKKVVVSKIMCYNAVCALKLKN